MSTEHGTVESHGRDSPTPAEQHPSDGDERDDRTVVTA
jgi:hypothetical protein